MLIYCVPTLVKLREQSMKFTYAFQEIHGFDNVHFEALFRNANTHTFDQGLLSDIPLNVQLETMLKLVFDYNYQNAKIHFNVSPSVSVNELIDLSLVCSRLNFEQSNLVLEFIECGLASYATLNFAKNLGFQVALDDFGRGFSIDNLFHQFVYDFIKLDKVFLKYEIQQTISSPLVQIIKQSFPDSLIIFEGVETKSDLDFVHSLGVDGIQGFYLSKPVYFTDKRVA